MPQYKYKARNKKGSIVHGKKESPTAKHLSQDLRSQGLHVLSVSESKGFFPFKGFSFFKSVKLTDLMLFTRQMYALILAGIPLVSALKSLHRSAKNPVLKDAISEVRVNIEAGMSFSAALEKHPLLFNTIFTSTIQAGEASGALPEVLSRLATALEKDHESQGRIKQAMSYPIIVTVFIVAAVLLLGFLVLPKFATMFDQFDAELPIFTKILMGFNVFLLNYWHISLFAIISFVLLLKYFLGTKLGQRVFGMVILKVPIFGPLYLRIVMERFARTVATLVKSGVPIVETLELAGEVTSNYVVLNAIHYVRNSVREGKGLAVSMAERPVFPDMIVQMVDSGEESGRIDELMEMVADFYEREADNIIKNMTTLIEPFILLFIAAIVMVMLLGIFLPLWNLTSAVK